MTKYIEEAATFLQNRGFGSPDIGIILGTGLGKIIDLVTIEAEMSYNHIPNFPTATVEFHKGKLIFGELAGKKVVIVGDILHSRVALSNIFCLQKLGAEVKVCGPGTMMPKYIESLGVSYEPDLRKALEWCDVANMLRIQLERQETKYFPSLREYTMLYGLDMEM